MIKKPKRGSHSLRYSHFYCYFCWEIRRGDGYNIGCEQIGGSVTDS